ncbi:MAG: hypothetical protein AABX99_01170, partial [Nanoarchaeota archaeon]
MQSSYSDKKQEIEKRIEELILKMKEINSKITYKQIQTTFEITKEQIESYITYLKSKGTDLFGSFLIDSSLFPKYEQTKNMTLEQKKQFPLQFMINVTVYNAEEPIMKITTEEDILNYYIRKNILIGLKLSEIMCKITFETLKKELAQQDILNNIEGL